MSILVTFFIIQIILLVLFILNDLTINKKKVKQSLLSKIKNLEQELKALKSYIKEDDKKKVKKSEDKNFVIIMKKSSILKKKRVNKKKTSDFKVFKKGILLKIVFLFFFYKILFGFFQIFIFKFSENLHDEKYFYDQKNKKFGEIKIRNLNKKIFLKYSKDEVLKKQIKKKILKKICKLNYIISKRRNFSIMPIIEEI